MIISLREFQLKPTKYLGDLPVTLTTYGKPIAKIVSVNRNTDVLTDKDKVLTENGRATKSVNTKKEVLEELRNDPSLGILRSVPKPEGKKKKPSRKFPSFRDKMHNLGKCQAQQCKKPAVDSIMVATHEGEESMNRLCKFHSAQAKKERGY